MRIHTSLAMLLCGGLLTACSSLSGPGGAPAYRVVLDADGEYQRGKQLHLAGLYMEAQSAYLKALSIQPGHAEARNGMAALAAALGDLDRAIALLEELARQQPAAHVLANLGHALQMKGRRFDAREAYERALAVAPDNEALRDALRRKLQDIEQQLGAEAPALVVDTPPPVPAAVQIDTVTAGVYAMRYALPQPQLQPQPVQVEVKAAAPVVQSVVQPVVQPTAARSPRPARSLTVELVNGNGVTGLARQLRALLPAQEWRVVRTINHQDFGVARTRIEYLPPHRPQARRLSEEMGVDARLQRNEEMAGIRLRVVLGHDCKDIDQLKARLAANAAQPAS